MSLFTQGAAKISDLMSADIRGEVADVIGLTIECECFAAPVGSVCEIHCRHADQTVEAEVVGFRGSRSILMPYGTMRGFSQGDPVRLLHARQTVPVGDQLIGRVLNALGEPIDGKPAPFCTARRDVYGRAPDAMERPRITRPIATGVKSVDGLFLCGRGQRMGIFSGSGVGKSTLLGMITRNTDADVVVLGLIGERGRELKEFIENDLGPDGLSRAVVVCETSDKPPLLRVKAAFTATAVAEHFREQGKQVMLLMDSITRMAMAQREIGLSAGEPPTTKGYPPSVFNMMPRLLERAGAHGQGSITAFYTVLVEGDDINEPIADTVRGILDGHIWLSRNIANKGRFPAVSVGDSISRLMNTVADKDHRAAAIRVRELLTVYAEAEDLINIGAYRAGSNPKIDEALRLIDGINAFLRQNVEDKYDLARTIQELKAAIEFVGEQPASAQIAQPALRTGSLPADVAASLAARGASAGSVPQQGRLVGRAAAPAEQRVVPPAAPGRQRMPNQQPPARPGSHPVQPPRAR